MAYLKEDRGLLLLEKRVKHKLPVLFDTDVLDQAATLQN
jgi:hypothetical protein